MSSRNPITIEVLETLDAIERRGSYAKAAEELNKATSAVSYAVQKLEEQLDIALFQRQGRRAVLTPAGQLVLEEGRHILSATARLANSAKEVATGWEPRIRVALEATQAAPPFFEVLAEFLATHGNIEIDVCESVLNGGWEALAADRVELLVGAPGPVPRHQGYRTIALGPLDLLPVISDQHALADQLVSPEMLAEHLPSLRRVISHDTATLEIARSEGLVRSGQNLYVQTMEQKLEAIVAGIGIGHLPRQRIQGYLHSGALRVLPLEENKQPEVFLAWKISNKGKGLKALTDRLAQVKWLGVD